MNFEEKETKSPKSSSENQGEGFPCEKADSSRLQRAYLVLMSLLLKRSGPRIVTSEFSVA